MISTVMACLFIVSGLWGIYFGLSGSAGDDAAATVILSGFLVVSGAGFLAHKSGMLGSVAPAPADDESRPSVDTVTNEKTEITDPDNQEAIFSVIGGEDDEDALDRVETFLEEDSRVESVVTETGRWYSVPDRDDLPEWIALRVYSREKDRDALMEMTRTFLAEKIGASLSVDYY